MSAPTPDLAIEAELLAAGHASVAGIDEVGRGAWAGPVTVGVALIRSLGAPPEGLRDSKLLSARRREELEPLLVSWAAEHAVGHASPAECDRLGMRAAIALAASRAIDLLGEPPAAVIVDGPLDLLFPSSLELSALVSDHAWRSTPPAELRAEVKADQRCASVAAASVIAKVARDRTMAALSESFPAYDLDSNAGYPSPTHQLALRGYGLTPLHRRSWRYVDDLPWANRWA